MSPGGTEKRRRSVHFDEHAFAASEAEPATEDEIAAPLSPSMVPEYSRLDHLSGATTDSEFLPKDTFDQLFTEERIAQELAMVGCLPLGPQHEVAKGDLETIKSTIFMNQENICKRRQIIAILILVEKLETIVDFIREGIDDNDLPFHYPLGGGFVKRTLKRQTNNGLKKIDLFDSWSSASVESSETQQWKIHIPIFNAAAEPGMQPPHWDLAPKTILPYVESLPAGKGGFGLVNKVRIQASHHDGFKVPKGEEQWYAVKKLINSTEAEFRKEVSSLSRFSGKNHPHLIRLLWTFSRGPTYHLVFPCADGNLMELWKEQSQPIADRHDPLTALWLARQCLGLSQGLCTIHQVDNNNSVEESRKRHGRHGDLKPENILWFKDFDNQQEGYGQGVLKISDFGLAGFHCTESKSRVNVNKRDIGRTSTYRAPEYDVHQVVAQSYDIWSLACVLLEFVTWYLRGWEEVDRFSELRKEEHRDPIMKEDPFFNYVLIHGKDGQRKKGALAKQSVVKEFQQLYEHENASDFTTDLLQFIQNRMLRMKPSRRASCTETRDKFRQFFDECQKNEAYCLKMTKPVPARADTKLSLLEPVPVERSGQLLSTQTEEPDAYGVGCDGPARIIQEEDCGASSVASKNSAIKTETKHTTHDAVPLTTERLGASSGNNQRATEQLDTATAAKELNQGLQPPTPARGLKIQTEEMDMTAARDLTPRIQFLSIGREERTRRR
ncbi:serine threonine kinase [Fusarium albosuccineum]|uniref:Serine threonine kinase n=1 Tax=Fusarium albosuccineum TaxID=1237068 RepID=A0A8H4PGF3_9HYPO|nr:serine threonine kinase [Fusarium albosuccineum]